MGKVNFEVHTKEEVYFVFKVILGILGYVSIFFLIVLALATKSALALIPILFYTVAIVLYIILQMGLLTGYLKGNAVKVGSRQFPDIHEIVLKQCSALELEKIPDVYILQSGGFLNAFATSFFGSNYVVIYSDILEEAYDNNKDTVEFVIGHELGHIKRKHMTKSVLFFPSFFVPFFNRAYSRACEYTCDNIGAALNPKGAHTGLLVLASGKKLWNKVDSKTFIEQEITEYGFWSWFAEKWSTHPKLTKRIKRFQNHYVKPAMATVEIPAVKEIVTDHSAYLPK